MEEHIITMNEGKCKYNTMVGCNGGACYKCGWNPRVAKERTTKILRVRAQSSEVMVIG